MNVDKLADRATAKWMEENPREASSYSASRAYYEGVCAGLRQGFEEGMYFERQNPGPTRSES